jgi:hypothetical protein
MAPAPAASTALPHPPSTSQNPRATFDGTDDTANGLYAVLWPTNDGAATPLLRTPWMMASSELWREGARTEGATGSTSPSDTLVFIFHASTRSCVR